MTTISTHVLDTAHGRPATGLRVTLSVRERDGWRVLGTADTDGDGRAPDLVPDDVALSVGVHRLHFATGAWFAAEQLSGFYPEVVIVFRIVDDEHHHVPLLLSPYGYSTYRGS